MNRAGWLWGTAGLAIADAAIGAAQGLWRLALMIISTGCAVAATAPYVRQTIAGVTKPRLVTWATWCLLTGLTGAASLASGDYASAVFALVGTAATGSVVIIGWRFGDRTVAVLDAMCLALVVVGLGLWRMMHRPAVAVLTACLIDFVGLVPTIVHAWTHPHEEAPAAFALIAAAAVAAAAAGWGDWTVTAQAYPVYVAVSAGLVAVLISRRRLARAAP
jgi:hypothetical protein